MMSQKETGRKGKKGSMIDVVVIGGGPGGSVTAKNCAQIGMRTLLLERKKLPRRKICSGFLSNTMTRTLIDREFGAIPDWVLTEPPYIYYLHRGMSPSSWDKPQFYSPLAWMPQAWRSDLDYWMVLKAKEAGAEIWDEATVTNITEESNGIAVKIRRPNEEQEIQAKFVVGADGAASTTRKTLQPDLDVRYTNVYFECYAGALEALDRKYAYSFEFDIPNPKPILDMFHIVFKKSCFHIDVQDLARPVKENMALAKETLAKQFGFDPASKPLWTDGTPIALLLDELLWGKLVQAKGNILLVGDAAGLTTPTYVGTGTAGIRRGGSGTNMALKSGILAANAIMKAAATSRPAADIYLTDLQPVMSVIRTLASDPSYGGENELRNLEKRDELLKQLI